ncbi:right-handed parallel beta-helix repeat-containing protein [Glacieibacterium megasporae]|uniref:right-handed parallel beta-helix repeat-containing protein n=1 Tax=Glacieibacterium megasporae TaxID=2835787 RepID=UPI001C1E3856|nr:right-handed parallel beta-helix repeat-containing protein [Polymorphobacter megasporae]UAJ12507.1 right-handed parallel beta-helix repeat-containing protein [Polymorphobacter megasporae]
MVIILWIGCNMLRIVNNWFIVFALIGSSPTIAATIKASSSTLANAWKTAKPGDVIKLSGSFGGIALQNKTFSTPVTLDASSATFTGSVKIQNVNGLNFYGGLFDSTSTKTAYNKAIVVYGGGNIQFDHVSINGNPSDRSGGIQLQTVKNARVTNSTFNGLSVGVGVVHSSFIALSNNQIINSVSDGFDVFDDHHVSITNNSCVGSSPSAGAHPDCVQLGSMVGHTVQSDITIANNLVYGNTQGLTSFDSTKGGGLRIIIENNILNALYPQGIACYSCVDSKISGNFLSPQPGSLYTVGLRTPDGVNNLISANTILALSSAIELPSNYRDAYFLLTGKHYVTPAAIPFISMTLPDEDLIQSSSPQADVPSRITVVPEPNSWATFLIGFAAIGLIQRHFNRNRRPAVKL